MNIVNWDTPRWAVRRLLETVWLPHGAWIEPCAGTGQIIQAVKEDRQGLVKFTAVEPRKECSAPLSKHVRRVYNEDFFDFNARDHKQLEAGASYFDVAITCPPSIKSMAIVSKCLAVAEYVAILQHSDWLNDHKHEFVRSCMPDIYLLPDMVRFMEDGRFVASPLAVAECAWFVWGPKSERFRAPAYLKDLEYTREIERTTLELEATS